jgi:hypothetical protein
MNHFALEIIDRGDITGQVTRVSTIVAIVVDTNTTVVDVHPLTGEEAVVGFFSRRKTDRTNGSGGGTSPRNPWYQCGW